MKKFHLGQEVVIDGTKLKGVVRDAVLGKDIEHFDNGVYVQEVILLTVEIELHPDLITPTTQDNPQ